MEIQKEEAKDDMPIREKNKSKVYHEREKVMAHGSTLDRLSRQLHGHFGRLPHIQKSWVEPNSLHQLKLIYIYIYIYAFFKLNRESW